jgi:hypothetical protein
MPATISTSGAGTLTIRGAMPMAPARLRARSRVDTGSPSATIHAPGRIRRSSSIASITAVRLPT